MPRKGSLLSLALIAIILPSAICDRLSPAHISDIGGPCGSSGSLCPPNAVCLSQQCQCIDGFVGSTDNKSCLPVQTEWEGSCTDNAQCNLFDDAVCRNGQCECDIGHHFIAGKCWVNKHLNDHCSNSNECLLSPNPDRIECNDGFCRCKCGYQINDLGNACNDPDENYERLAKAAEEGAAALTSIAQTFRETSPCLCTTLREVREEYINFLRRH